MAKIETRTRKSQGRKMSEEFVIKFKSKDMRKQTDMTIDNKVMIGFMGDKGG